MQISLDARQMLVRDVYDGLLSSALSVVSKLNLSVRQQASSDDGVGIEILRWIEDTFPERRTLVDVAQLGVGTVKPFRRTLDLYARYHPASGSSRNTSRSQ